LNLSFNDEELRRIKFLRFIYQEKFSIAWLVGVSITIFVFLIQFPFKDHQLIHSFCTYGSIPVGAGVGIWLNGFLGKHADDELLNKWDPIFYQRSGKTQAQMDAETEVLRLTDSIQFIALPLDQQRLIVNKIYKERGLPEPNNTSDNL
jgi:hypothetical protein